MVPSHPRSFGSLLRRWCTGLTFYKVVRYWITAFVLVSRALGPSKEDAKLAAEAGH